MPSLPGTFLVVHNYYDFSVHIGKKNIPPAIIYCNHHFLSLAGIVGNTGNI